MSSTSPDPSFKGSSWKSLLSVLLDADAEPMDIYLAEMAPGGEWDYAFWHRDPDGVMCAFRCPRDRSLWCPVETPCYTGRVEPYEYKDRSEKRPWHADQDPI